MNPIIVTGPDGAEIEFPAGTDRATIQRVMRQRYGGPGAAPTATTDRPRLPEWPEDVADRNARNSRLPATGATAAAAQPFAGFNRGLDNAISGVSSLGRIFTDRIFEGANAAFGTNFDTSVPSARPISAAQNAATGQDYDDLPVNNAWDRYSQRVGEEVGASVPAVTAIGAAGQTANLANAGRNAGIFQTAIQDFARRPGAYMGAELASSTASGTGAQIARDVAPGNTAAEMTGQLAGPLGLFGGAATLRSMFRGAGDDAARTAQGAIDDARRAGTTLTAGQLSTRSADDITVPGMLEGGVRNTPGGNVVMPRVYARQQDEIAAGVDRLVRGITELSSPEAAGRSIRQGVDNIVSQFQRDADGFYRAVDDLIPGPTPVRITNAQRTAQQIAQANPSGALGDALGNSRVNRIVSAVLTDEPRTYQDLARARSRIGAMLNDRQLIGTEAEAPLRRLYGALTDDMAKAAARAGPEAEAAMRQANDFYREGRRAIDDYVEPFVSGRRGTNPETSFREFELAANRGPTAIREFRNRVVMSPGGQQAWDDAVGVTIRRMGVANPSQQGADGAEFSIETFLTNWNRMQRNGGLDELFQGTSYAGMRDDLDAIARTAERMRGNFGNLRNPSGSGNAAVTGGTLLASGTALASGNTSVGGTLLLSVGGSAGIGTLMSRPWFVRWLAQSTEGSAERLPTYLSRLAATAQMAGSEEDQRLVAEYIDQVQRRLN